MLGLGLGLPFTRYLRHNVLRGNIVLTKMSKNVYVFPNKTSFLWTTKRLEN
jgi:hypothetical protein